MSQQVLKHTYRHFADLQISANEFYSELEAIIASYQYPDIEIGRRFLFEAGTPFDDKREYLVIRRKRLSFYVCAAPYGKGYFVSWWFWYRQSWILDWIFRSPVMSYLFEDKEATMYKQDTRAMFESSINSLITEFTGTIDPIHGFRKASDPALN